MNTNGNMNTNDNQVTYRNDNHIPRMGHQPTNEEIMEAFGIETPAKRNILGNIALSLSAITPVLFFINLACIFFGIEVEIGLSTIIFEFCARYLEPFFLIASIALAIIGLKHENKRSCKGSFVINFFKILAVIVFRIIPFK